MLQHVDSISINFDVHVYRSSAIVFYQKKVIMKQILMYIESICLYYKIWIMTMY